MKPIPYVGITGFKRESEVKYLAKIFDESGFKEGTRYKPMFGFIASPNRLANEYKGGKESPALAKLPDLLELVPSYALR